MPYKCENIFGAKKVVNELKKKPFLHKTCNPYKLKTSIGFNKQCVLQIQKVIRSS